MDELFRSFFGIPNRGSRNNCPKDDFTNFHNYSEKNSHGEDDDIASGDPNKFDFSFNILAPHDIFRHFEGLFADMDNIMQSLEHQEFPAVEPHQENPSLREKMLKDDVELQLKDGSQDKWMDRYQQQPNSFWNRMWRGDGWTRQQDSDKDFDLDTLVKSRGLESILPNKSGPADQGSDIQVFSRPGPFGRAFSSTFSSTIVYSSANRQSEEKRTVRDSRGNVETVTTRTVDGQTWTERVRTDPSGKVIESYADDSDANIRSEQDKKQFDDSRWQSSDQRDSLHDLLSPAQQYQPNSDVHSIFKNIFGFQFPGFSDGKT